MSTLWWDTFVAFDTETSGFGSKARVLELGVVTFEHCRPVREWSMLLWPGDIDWESDNTKGALAVNGLSREVLLGKPTFEEVLPDLLLELSCDILVAHNARFDMEMVSNELVRLNRSVPAPKFVVCTQNLATHFSPNEESQRLKDVTVRYGVIPDGAHRATADAKACGHVLARMIERGLLPEDQGVLQEFLGEAKKTRKARYNKY